MNLPPPPTPLGPPLHPNPLTGLSWYNVESVATACCVCARYFRSAHVRGCVAQDLLAAVCEDVYKSAQRFSEQQTCISSKALIKSSVKPYVSEPIFVAAACCCCSYGQLHFLQLLSQIDACGDYTQGRRKPGAELNLCGLSLHALHAACAHASHVWHQPLLQGRRPL